MDDGILEELPCRDQPVELLVGDEDVVDAVNLTGTRRARRHRDRQPHLGIVGADVCRDRPLPDCGRAGENDQPSGTSFGEDERFGEGVLPAHD